MLSAYQLKSVNHRKAKDWILLILKSGLGCGYTGGRAAAKALLDEYLELVCEVTKVGRLPSKPQYSHLDHIFSCLPSFGKRV